MESMSSSPPARILIYGVTGSGKTTLARRVSERLRLPLHLVDDLRWEPGWVAVPTDLQRARIEAVCSTPAWVLDSAYGAWIDAPLAAADLVVGLDFPRHVSLSRLLVRSVRRVVRKTPACNGNTESLGRLLSRDSILVWHFQAYARTRRTMRHWQDSLSGPQVLLFRNQSAVDEWLNALPA